MNTNDFSYAAKFRDVINKMITAQVDKIRPRPSVGIVTAVNDSNKTVLVLYPGDTVSVPVSYGALVPGVGATVLIEGIAERRYVADVISGPFTAGSSSSALSGMKFLGHFRYADGTTKFATDAITISGGNFAVPLTETLTPTKNYYFDIIVPYWAGLIRLEVDSFVELTTASGNNLPTGQLSTAVYVCRQNPNGSFSRIGGERTIPGAIPLPPYSGLATATVAWRAVWDIVFVPLSYTSPVPHTTNTGNLGIAGNTERLYLAAQRVTIGSEILNTTLQSMRMTVTALGTANDLPQLF